MLSIIILNFNFAECCYKCGNAECPYAECHYAECHYAERHFVECHYAESCYAECSYAECRMLSVFMPHQPSLIFAGKTRTLEWNI
jgi:hypothetical protein